MAKFYLLVALLLAVGEVIFAQHLLYDVSDSEIPAELFDYEFEDNIMIGNDPEAIGEIESISSGSAGADADVDSEQEELNLIPSEDSSAADEVPEEWTPQNNYGISNLLTGLYYQVDYNRINDELVDNVPSDDVQSNMDYARDWLARELSSKVSQIFKQSLIKALEQFTALASINSSNKCNKETFAILYKNNKATKDRVHKRPSELPMPLRRIEKLVHHYMMEHAIACLPIYPKTFKSIREQMDRVTLERVELFQNQLIEQRRTIQKASLFGGKKLLGASDSEVSMYITSIGGTDMGRMAYDLLKKMASGDPDARYLDKVVDEKKGRMVVEREKIAALISRYLVEPCKHFIRITGPSVFKPANYDARVLEREDTSRLEGDEFEALILGNARYRLCKMMVRDDKKLASGVVWVAEKQQENKE